MTDDRVVDRETRLTQAACTRADEIKQLIDQTWPGQDELNQTALMILTMVFFGESPAMRIEAAIQMVIDVYMAVQNRNETAAKEVVIDLLTRAITGRRRRPKSEAEPAAT